MITYITYYYTEDGEYQLWGLNLDHEETLTSLREKHIPFLIEGCQPDTCELRVIRVDIPKDLYSTLEFCSKEDEEDEISCILEELEDFEKFDMVNLYTIPGDIWLSLVEFYYQMNTDPEDFDPDVGVEFDLWREKLDTLQSEEPDKYEFVLKQFIENL